MRVPVEKCSQGILQLSENYNFPSTINEREKQLFYYIPWCGHLYCDSRYIEKRDSYPFCLVAYVLKGTLHYTDAQNDININAGDILVAELSEPHAYYGNSGLEFIYIHFDGSNSHELCKYFLENNPPKISQSNNELIREYIQKTLAFYSSYSYENTADTSYRVYRLIRLLFTNEGFSSTKEKRQDIQKTILYINQHIHEQITLEQLCGIVHLSPFYFNRLFKKETGMSPIEYISNIRINKAKLLLISTGFSITEIAMKVGYTSPTTFTNTFTRHVGCSPRTFRKKLS